MNNDSNTQAPDPEVRQKAKRRHFTDVYKLTIVEQADKCTKPGEIEALLRREGLYSSHLGKWRQQRDNGELTKAGTAKATPHPAEKRVRQLETELAQARRQLKQAQTVIEVQKKLCDLLDATPVTNSAKLL